MTRQLMYFAAPWCQPCKQIRPKVEAMCRRHSIPIDVVDIDQRQEIAQKYHVMSVPTAIAWFGDGEIRTYSPLQMNGIRNMEKRFTE